MADLILALRLFWAFCKTGLFAVGGGLATLPFLQEMSVSTGWFDAADISNMIAISESTPGPLGVNMATYVGYKTLGLVGGLVATAGLVCPALICIVLISKVLNRFKESRVVERIFYGLRPASTGLIAAAGLGVAGIAFLHGDAVAGRSYCDWPLIALAAVIYVAYKRFRWHPIVYIACAAMAGVILHL